MTIRSRLLLLLIPPLTLFLILISFFFYFNWSREILNGFEDRLKSIVVATSQTITPSEIKWLTQHIQDPQILQDPTYQNYQLQLATIQQKFPITNLYIIQLAHHQNKNDHSFSNSNLHSSILLQTLDEKKALTSPSQENKRFEIDEKQVYLSKQSFVTPIYENHKTHERLISAYAPILNENGDVLALLGADVSMREIDHKLNRAWLMIFLGLCVTLLLLISTVFLIADRISKPVRQLNQGALEIAAGDYEANIKVEGPKEIVELAHTLNTMSECLVEHMSRLRESSLIRERMYGEYECALLLQHYMLQKVIEDFQNPHLRVRLITLPLTPLQKGLSLKFDRSSVNDLSFTLLEAQETGFTGLFHLNQWAYLPKSELKNKSFIECQFVDHYRILRYHTHALYPPLVWSVHSQQFIKSDQQEIALHNRDMVFLYSSSLIEQFETKEAIEGWFSRVLRHFAEDGIETIHTMLTNELTFLAKKQQTKLNFKIIAFQLNINETNV